MRNIKRQGFTLVELIVVITILAILGTIAFISLQGYSADARNTKRSSNLDQIQSAISTKQTQGATLLSMLTSDTNSRVTAISIAGTAAVAGTDYDAGTINYTALGMKQTDFVDPSSNKPYVIGATTKADGKYELAASMENGGGNRTARILGNWSPRTTATYAITGTGTNTVSLSANNTITNLKIGDTVTAGGSGSLTILNVSPDGQTFTLSANAGATPATIALSANESAGLIDAAGTTTGTVTNNGAVLPY